MRVSGKKVLITGAGSGIGRETARIMARKGGKLLLTDISSKGLEQTAASIRKDNGEVLKTAVFDVGDYAAYADFANNIHEEFGAVDILVNNAGIAILGFVEDMTHEHWEKTIKVNLWGVIHGIECIVPEMIKRKSGHVVNVASTAGLVGLARMSTYCTSKFACVGLSEVLLYDLGRHNIKVSVVCPGIVYTPMFDSIDIVSDREKSEPAKGIAKKFSISAEDCARQIVEAVEKNRFLVQTSFDARFLYFLKRHAPWLYFPVTRLLSRMADKKLADG